MVAVDRVATEREQGADATAGLRVPSEGEQAGFVDAVDECLRPPSPPDVHGPDATGGQPLELLAPRPPLPRVDAAHEPNPRVDGPPRQRALHAATQPQPA